MVAAGCSATTYCWPTWADYLGRQFSSYINIAVCGADNAVIARNIMLAAQPGDVVVINWTGFDRFNQFLDNHKQENKNLGDQLVIKSSGMTPDDDNGGWYHIAPVIAQKEFLVNYYHRIERFRHTLDYVKMVQMHSQLVGYDVWNFTATDWFRAMTEKNIDPRLVTMHHDMSFPQFYLDSNIAEIQESLNLPNIKHKYNNNDSHPTPWAHWLWLRDHISPVMDIELDPELESLVKRDHERVLQGDVG